MTELGLRRLRHYRNTYCGPPTAPPRSLSRFRCAVAFFAPYSLYLALRALKCRPCAPVVCLLLLACSSAAARGSESDVDPAAILLRAEFIHLLDSLFPHRLRHSPSLCIVAAFPL